MTWTLNYAKSLFQQDSKTWTFSYANNSVSRMRERRRTELCMYVLIEALWAIYIQYKRIPPNPRLGAMTIIPLTEFTPYFMALCTISHKILHFQVNYYVQSHIQINEYRDRYILVSVQIILHVQLDHLYELS